VARHFQDTESDLEKLTRHEQDLQAAIQKREKELEASKQRAEELKDKIDQLQVDASKLFANN